jgi:hypothetical protein
MALTGATLDGGPWNGAIWQGGPVSGNEASTGVLTSVFSFSFFEAPEFASASVAVTHPLASFRAAMSLNLWIKRTEPPPVAPETMVVCTRDTVNDWQAICFDAGDVVVQFFQNASRWARVRFTNLVPYLTNGDWHHLVITQPDTGPINVGNPMTPERFGVLHRCWVDGVERTSRTFEHGQDIRSETSPTATLFLGGCDGAFPSVGGLLDEVAIFTSEISLGEVQALWNKGIPQPIILAFYPTLLNHWPCGELHLADLLLRDQEGADTLDLEPGMEDNRRGDAPPN